MYLQMCPQMSMVTLVIGCIFLSFVHCVFFSSNVYCKNRDQNRQSCTGCIRFFSTVWFKMSPLIVIIYIMILSDMENLLSVRENVLSIAKVTKSGEYCIKKRESVISSKIVINYNILIWFGEYSYLVLTPGHSFRSHFLFSFFKFNKNPFGFKLVWEPWK